MKDLVKVEGRTEQLLGFTVDKMTFFGPQDQICTSEVMETILLYAKKNLQASFLAPLNERFHT